MAASSSSSSHQMKYDVFLSFRGEDTRYNFTSHLYSALCQKKIDTFIDNELKRGDEISPSLLDAIEASRISIVIFSERYASSRWCLEELVKILKCKNKYGQIVIPVFYGVDPSDVRNQTGIFRDTFMQLEERVQESLDKLKKWRTALREAADLSGFDSRVIRDESVLIGEIVEYVLKRLKVVFPIDYGKGLVGVELKIRQIERLLRLGSEDICSIGIWGIGGIGKTTIADAIFNKICDGFEGSCFIRNVREESEKNGGLAQLRQILFSTLLEDKNVKIYVPNICFSFESKRLSCKKVLVVLDDVTSSEQTEFLIGSVNLFGIGSRIIITTRDKQVLKNCQEIEIYEMQELRCDAALELFSRHAFRKDKLCLGYEELSNEVVKYAHGVPLALKLLGHFLIGRSKEDWKSTISRLQRIPDKDIQKVLKISYDGLEDEEQNIFLDIACFLKGEDKNLIIKFLNACGFSTQIAITVLVDKALITISSSNMITMHDLLQEMGREIVRQESVNNPGKRSRLWHPKDIYEVLTYNTGTKAIQGISLDMSNVEEMHLDPHTFTKMRKLRFLKFHGANKCRMSHFEGPGFSEIRYLHWDECPLKSLPSSIQPEIIFSLQLRGSAIKELWNGVQNLDNLKQIDLKDCRQLKQLPNLSQAPNLESLTLEGCTSLIEIESSIQHLNKLEILDLRDCISLKSLPTSLHLESLKKICLSGCSNLTRFPDISSYNIEELLLSGISIEELPSSIGCLCRLVTLDLRECKRLESLPSALCELKSLQYLYLSGCSNLQRLPENIGDLKALKELHAERIALREVPLTIVHLYNLATLSFKGFRGHVQGFLLPTSLPLYGLHSLRTLNLSDCGITELPGSLGLLFSLESLYLDRNNFDRVPESLTFLFSLCKLNISYCERLKSLPELPENLYQMDATHCTSLEALSHLSILFRPRPSNVSEVFQLTNCFKLDQDELSQIVGRALQRLQLKATKRFEIDLRVIGNEDSNEMCDQAVFGRFLFEPPNAEIDKEDLNEMCDQAVFGQIYYPGSEIPEWFEYQSIGSSITPRLPEVSVDDNFRGIAFCVIVAFGDHHHSGQRFYVSAEYMLKTKDTHGCVSSEEKYSLFDRRIGIDYVGLDHVLFGYYFVKFLNCEYYSDHELFFQFYIEDEDGNRMECCKVKKCGIHLFYNKKLDVPEFREWESSDNTSEYSQDTASQNSALTRRKRNRTI